MALTAIEAFAGRSICPDRYRDGAWAYIDTSEALGVMLEAIEPTTEMPPWEPCRPA